MTQKKGTGPAARRPPGVQLGDEAARSAILQGAAAVFDERGVRGASVEHILEVAGVSRRTFYRHYDSKDAVALELYQMGTQLLLDECRLAAVSAPDTLRLVERCIDAHLRTAQAFGRLMFVLGGEAQLPESALHGRRAEIQEAILQILAESLRKQARLQLDPMLLRAIILSLEAIPRMALQEGNEGRSVTPEQIQRARACMMRVGSSILEGTGPRVAPLPRP